MLLARFSNLSTLLLSLSSRSLTNRASPKTSSISFVRTKTHISANMAPIGENMETQSPVKKAPRLEKEVESEPSEIAVSDSPAERVVLRFAKLSENAYTPTRGSKQAAGYDLCSAYEYTIPAKGKGLAKTDIQIALPEGCYGRVAPRSGLAYKKFIDVGAGVIDQDYRGNVGVVLFNFGEEDFVINKGDRIAQLILERIYLPYLQELPTLDDTDRGAGGFGSTGTK